MVKAYAMQTQIISDSCVFHDGGFSNTLVWFGGLHENFLNKEFLVKFEINGLFLKDINFDWYMKGLSGIAEDHTSSAVWMKKFLTNRTKGVVAIAGQSSGGYAALHYSHALKPDVCIAFAPQTHNRVTAAGLLLPGIELVPLNQLYSSDMRSFPISIHLSRSEDKNTDVHWEDWKQADQFLKFDNVTVTRHPSDIHAVSLFLYSKKSFYQTIFTDMMLHTDGFDNLLREGI